MQRLLRWWQRTFSPPPTERLPTLEFTFAALGRLAKSTGRVTEAHVAFVEALVTTLGFSRAERVRAIDDFRAGKEDHTSFATLAAEIHDEAPLASVLELMNECLYRAAWLHGPPNVETRTLLNELTVLLSLGERERARLDERMAQMYQQSLPSELVLAYTRLEVAAIADDSIVKAAFRRQASRHHPDKHPNDAASHDRFIAAEAAWRTIEAHRHPPAPRRSAQRAGRNAQRAERHPG